MSTFPGFTMIYKNDLQHPSNIIHKDYYMPDKMKVFNLKVERYTKGIR